MRNSKQWWEEMKSSTDKFNDWLVKQYRGEVTAATRIRQLYEKFKVTEKEKVILETIACQEETHAEWVLQLLSARGVTPSVENAEKRYWKNIFPQIKSKELGCAVASHAERMRLERIRVIVEDETSPEDVRAAFTKILKDEVWHELAFKKLSTKEAMSETLDQHELGLKALGLVV